MFKNALDYNIYAFWEFMFTSLGSKLYMDENEEKTWTKPRQHKQWQTDLTPPSCPPVEQSFFPVA